jgi:hypothetical protein
MRVPRQFRSPLPLLLAVAVMAVTGPAASAQVVLGLPDDEPAQAVAKHQASPQLHSGMQAIRTLVLNAHSLVTHRRLSPGEARRFAAALKRHVADLQPSASDPVQREVLTPIAAAAEPFAVPVSGDSQLDALDKIEAALNRYPQLVDDTAWQPLR